MPVNETAALERELADEVGVAVDRIYCNGLYPERFAEAEAERLAAAAPRGRRRPRAPACAPRSPSTAAAATQREQLARLERETKAPVRTLPFLFEPELGVEQIGALARHG